MHQGLLFPDGFEVLEQALAALRNVDVARAARFVRQARATRTGLVDLDLVEQACDYLGERLAIDPDPDACAATLLAVPGDVEAMRLRAEVGRFVDMVVARYLVRLAREGAFVDRLGRLPWARVLLVVGQAAAAYRSLGDLAAIRQRADLLWLLGDAALLVDRADEANASFVRALVIDPQAVDCFRLQHAGLQASCKRPIDPPRTSCGRSRECAARVSEPRRQLDRGQPSRGAA